jgi:hypothetical protein
VRTPAPPWITSTTLSGFDDEVVDAAEPPVSVANNDDGNRHDVAIDAADALRKRRLDGFDELADVKPLHWLDR